MSGAGGNQDLVAMKELLNSWHVGILYDLFKEEDITTIELKMMQLNHIYELLKHHKMGVRIRFEHHFNNWRNKIGIPLKTPGCNYHYAICCNCKKHIDNNSKEEPGVQDAITNTMDTVKNGSKKRRLDQNGVALDRTEFNENQPPLSPQSVNSTNSLINMLTSNEIVNFMPVPVLDSPSGKVHNTDDEAEMENLPLTSLADTLSEPAYTPPKFPSKPNPEKTLISLKQILEKSGARGTSILQFYKEKNRLTNIHRTQLIQTIVDFFDENDFHLSLNMSHILEWEILKMFPTERLEYYRTEKRGKIYVKFSNMKRYKRERNNKARTEMESFTRRSNRFQGKDKCNTSENMDTKDAENFYVEPEIMVKEEGLSDNEVKF